jgi:hypothetical protein
LRIAATLMAPALGMRVLSGDWLLSLSHVPADGANASELDNVTTFLELLPRVEVPLQTLLDQFADYLDNFPDIVSAEFDRQARFLNYMLENKISMAERLALVRGEMCPSMKIASVNRSESSLLRPEALHYYVKIMECVNVYKELVEARKQRTVLRIAEVLDSLEKNCGAVSSALEQQVVLLLLTCNRCCEPTADRLCAQLLAIPRALCLFALCHFARLPVACLMAAGFVCSCLLSRPSGRSPASPTQSPTCSSGAP